MKNKSAIILLFIANSISGIAQGISMIAIPWYFIQQGEMSLFGQIYVMTNVVSLLWVPYSGTFVDRFNRKHLFLIISIVSGLILATTSALGYYWGYLPWYMVAFIFMMTFFNYNIHYPNLYAFVQEITEEKYYGKLTSYIEIQGQLTSVLAGAGAALLLEGVQSGTMEIFGMEIAIPFKFAAWQIHEIFLLDASTYALALCFIYFIRYQSLKERKTESGNFIQQLKIGFQYLKEKPNVFLFGVASYSIFVTVLITTFYLAAAYVKNHLIAEGDVYATSEMYYALGALFAGIAIRQIFKKMSIPLSVIIMTGITTILFLTLSITESILIFYLMLLILGITNAGTRIQRTTYLFQHIPNQVYGRATSVFFISNILFRIFFLSLFSLVFFQSSNNVIYAFAILSLFLFLSNIVLVKYFKTF